MFAAHRPHPAYHETWFAYWKDDGFKLKKGKRVETRSWPDTEAQWLERFHRRAEVFKYSVLKHVTEHDEWCAEAYLEPDYTEIKADHLRAVMREYVLHAFRLATGKEADPQAEAE